MSHIHLPDGVLPVWLWLSGFLVTLIVGLLLFRFTKKEDVKRKLPLLGMMSAVMVLGASVEIVPIAYHVNLTAISGIMLGPSLVFVSTFLVNVILALFGHGGVTVIGLNTLTLSIEGVVSSLLFRLFWRISRRLTLSVFLGTFVALFLSTLAMVGVVALGTSHYESLIHADEDTGIFDFNFSKGESGHSRAAANGETLSLRRFVAVLLPLGFIGWILEAVITSLIARYIHRLRPDLLRLKGQNT